MQRTTTTNKVDTHSYRLAPADIEQACIDFLKKSELYEKPPTDAEVEWELSYVVEEDEVIGVSMKQRVTHQTPEDEEELEGKKKR